MMDGLCLRSWEKLTHLLFFSSCSYWSTEPSEATPAPSATSAWRPMTSPEWASTTATLTWSGFCLKERSPMSECGSSASPSYEETWRWADDQGFTLLIFMRLTTKVLLTFTVSTKLLTVLSFFYCFVLRCIILIYFWQGRTEGRSWK